MRETKAALFWVVVFALIVAGVVWWLSRRPERETAHPPGAQEVTVHFLKDGDSMEIAALAPGKVVPATDPVQARLLGIDAPEMHGGANGGPQCWAEAAKAELQKLAPHGGRLWVIGDEHKQDNYGRYLLYAWTPDGVFVNEALASSGAVRELAIKPNFGYQEELGQKVFEARRARRGLWGACTN